MHVNEVLRRGANAGLFPQFAFGGLQQRLIGLQVARRLVPQRFAVNGLFDDEEFILGVNHAGNGDMRFKHRFSFLVIRLYAIRRWPARQAYSRPWRSGSDAGWGSRRGRSSGAPGGYVPRKG